MAILDESPPEPKSPFTNAPEGYFDNSEIMSHLAHNIYNNSQESYENSIRSKRASKIGFSIFIFTSFIAIIYLGSFLSSNGFSAPCYSVYYLQYEFSQCTNRESLYSNNFYSQFIAYLEIDLASPDSFEKLALVTNYDSGYLAYHMVTPSHGICVEIQPYPLNNTFSCSLSEASFLQDYYYKNPKTISGTSEHGNSTLNTGIGFYQENNKNDNNNAHYLDFYHYYGEDNNKNNIKMKEQEVSDQSCDITYLEECPESYHLDNFQNIFHIYVYASNRSLFSENQVVNVTIEFVINLQSTSSESSDYSFYIFIYVVIGVCVCTLGCGCCLIMQCMAYYYHRKQDRLFSPGTELESFLSSFAAHSPFHFSFMHNRNFYLDEYAIQLDEIQPNASVSGRSSEDSEEDSSRERNEIEISSNIIVNNLNNQSGEAAEEV